MFTATDFEPGTDMIIGMKEESVEERGLKDCKEGKNLKSYYD